MEKTVKELPKEEGLSVENGEITPQQILTEVGKQFSITVNGLENPDLTAEESVRLESRLSHLYSVEQIVIKHMEHPDETTGTKKLYVGQVLANCILVNADPASRIELRNRIAGALGRVSMHSSETVSV